MSDSHAKNSLSRAFSAASAINLRSKKKRPAPVSMRFSDEERELLELHARGKALGPYLKQFVLKAHQIKRKPAQRSPSKQDQAIARALRGLGRSGVVGVLNGLLLAVEEQRLLLDPDDELEQRRAGCELASLRNDLVVALGLHQDEAV